MANKRKVYHVVPKGNQWAVEVERRILQLKSTKDQAIDAARGLATREEPSQVVVHLGTGQTETEYTYGSDPFPPAG